MQIQDYLASLRTEVWRTESARYDAARRLRRRELLGTMSLALFSSISIGVAFVQQIYGANNGALNSYLSSLSAILGVVLLAISLMEWGGANGVKAEALHRNAEDLNSFQKKLALLLSKLNSGEAVRWEAVEQLRDEYDGIKKRCAYNHEPIDDLHFRASHRSAPEFLHDQIGLAEKCWIVFRWYWASVWYFACFWAAIGIAIGFAFTIA